jgi:hypothetical protein
MRCVLVALLGLAHVSYGDANPDKLRGCAQDAARSVGDKAYIPAAGLACWHYMSAVQDMSVLVDERAEHLLGICPPADSTLRQYVQAFVQFAHKNRRELYYLEAESLFNMAIASCTVVINCAGKMMVEFFWVAISRGGAHPCFPSHPADGARILAHRRERLQTFREEIPRHVRTVAIPESSR